MQNIHFGIFQGEERITGDEIICSQGVNLDC